MSYPTNSTQLPLRPSPRGLERERGYDNRQYQENRHARQVRPSREERFFYNSRQRGPPPPPRSVILPAQRPPNAYSPEDPSQHPAPVPRYIPELATAIFSAPTFLHLYLAPGQLGVLASPENAHQNPDVTRPVIILHPNKDYKKLMERIAHAVKSVNPPAWGVSDLPPANWEGWGIKLFLPRNGPRSKTDSNIHGPRLIH